MALLTITPFSRWADITKSDTVNLDGSVSATGAKVKPCDAIYVGGAGIVAAVFQDNSVVNFTAVAGEILPIRIKRVNAANTTATLMVALFLV